MKGILICTIALEYNYSKSSTQSGSVWLFKGDGSVDLEKSDALNSLPGWTRIVGPIDYDQASQIVSALKTFFEQCGVTVIDKGITD